MYTSASRGEAAEPARRTGVTQRGANAPRAAQGSGAHADAAPVRARRSIVRLERRPEQQPLSGGHSLANREPARAQAGETARQATTRWVWVPSPSIPSRMTSPPFKNTLGFCPMPTPGGVPVVMTSPGISVMKVEQ